MRSRPDDRDEQDAEASRARQAFVDTDRRDVTTGHEQVIAAMDPEADPLPFRLVTVHPADRTGVELPVGGFDAPKERGPFTQDFRD